ncbi:MAG: gamma-glutamylcyclotransferase [Bdellovibrionaceae bacterium]|nr:gamma-glutamylcyclotransferase [Pseudobdellovibrionaceae bacterium]
MDKLYFAYGSNLSPKKQVKEFGKEFVFVCVARLENAKICFPQYSRKNDCDVASFVCSSNSSVWGCVFKLTQDQMSKLDRQEGWKDNRPSDKNSYEKKQVRVLSSSGEELKAYPYQGNKAKPDEYKGPSEEYLTYILEGLKYRVKDGIPMHYIDEVKVQARKLGNH